MYSNATKKIFSSCLSALILAIWCASAKAASPAGLVRQGSDFFEKGKYEESASKFREALEKNEESEVVNFNLGTALYKQGDWANAIQYLKKALLSEEEGLQSKARYNLGNALYRDGINKEKKDLNAAISSLEESLAQYDALLSADAKDADASFNREFVKKELDRLKKKREQQKQQSQQDKNQSNSKEEENADQNQSQDKDNSSQQDNKSQQSSGDQGAESDGEEGNQANEQRSDDKKQKGEQNQNADSQDGEKKDAKAEQSDKAKTEKKSSSSESTDNKQQEQSMAPLAGQQISQEEAMKLLNVYQNTEEPKGLLNLFKGTATDVPVSKDW